MANITMGRVTPTRRRGSSMSAGESGGEDHRKGGSGATSAVFRSLVVVSVFVVMINVALQLLAVGSQSFMSGPSALDKESMPSLTSQSSRKGVSVDRVFELMTADIGDIRQQVETAVATMKGQQDQGQQWASGQFVADLAKEMETLQRNHRLLLDVFSAAVVAVGATPAHGVSDRKPRAQLAVITEPGGHLGEFMTFLLSDEDLFLLKEPCKSSGVAGKPTYDANCAELVQRWLTCSPEASDVVGLFKHTSVVEALPAVLHRYHDVAKAAGGNLEAASLLRQLVINECKQSRAVVVGEIRMEYILADVFTSHTHVLHLVRDPRATLLASLRLWEGSPIEAQAAEVCRRTMLKIQSGKEMKDNFMMVTYVKLREDQQAVPFLFEWSGIGPLPPLALQAHQKWLRPKGTSDNDWPVMLSGEQLEAVESLPDCRALLEASKALTLGPEQKQMEAMLAATSDSRIPPQNPGVL